MTRKRILSCVIVASIAFACGVTVNSWIFADKRMNIVLITLDTTRADHLGCYGNPHALTPTLDGLAKRGVLFENAYTTVPLTLPAHASIHTGLQPFEHGLFTNGSHGLPDQIPTMAEELAASGYETGAFVAAFVLNHLFGLDRGFKTYDDNVDGPTTFEPAGERKRSADQVIDSALSWLTVNRHKPFFCWVHLFDPHAEYLDHRETFGDRFRGRPYDGEIAFVDMQLKRLVDFLDMHRLASQTMIVVVGDHGEGLSEHRERWHGYLLYNSTLRIPMIVSGPNVRGNQRVLEPVSLVDVAPTVLDCLNLPNMVPDRSHSLKPTLMGEPLVSKACYGVAKEAFLEEGWSPLSCLVTREWKYIHTSKPELYNLIDDPGEMSNLATSHSDRLKEMKNQLLELEASAVRYPSQSTPLSDRERKNLVSLGYLRSPDRRNESSVMLTDIKDRLDDFDKFQNALQLYIEGPSESAIVPLYQLIHSAPNYLAPRLLLARVLRANGKGEEAETQYLAILDVDPENEESHENLGELYASRKQFEPALTHLIKALGGSPHSISLHRTAGRVLKELGRPKEAMLHLQAAERLWYQQNARRKPAKSPSAATSRK